MKSKGKATLIMAYCLEKKTIQKKGEISQGHLAAVRHLRQP